MRDPKLISNKILIIKRNLIKTLPYTHTYTKYIEDSEKKDIYLIQKVPEYHNNNKKSEIIEIMKKLRKINPEGKKSCLEILLSLEVIMT